MSRLLHELDSLDNDGDDEALEDRQDELAKELALTKDLRDCMALMVIVFLPADGEGKTVVGEEILAWVNETDPSQSIDACGAVPSS